MILLDTDVCVAILRGYSNAVASYSRNRGNVAISAMTVGELFLGAEKSADRERNAIIAERFVESLPVVHTNNAIMRRFGVEKARLQRLGTTVADADALIAATALSIGCPLATGNVRHFSRFSDLELFDWLHL